jgi:predicted ribosomally synthesized peptide with SipW-like signal peptide
MSNKKLLAATAAGVAALIAVGGGTFATWNDYDEFANSAGADHLVLDVNSSETLGFSQEKMYPTPNNPIPGDTGNREFDFSVASRDGDEVPNASLTMTLLDLLGEEDGCQGNTEVEDDGGECTTPGTGPNRGNFIHDARLIINASAPVAENQACPTRGSRQSAISLANLENDVVNLLPAGETLAAGEKVCIGMGLSLPQEADNASQGDSATWDFRIDLKQLLPGQV